MSGCGKPMPEPTPAERQAWALAYLEAHMAHEVARALVRAARAGEPESRESGNPEP